MGRSGGSGSGREEGEYDGEAIGMISPLEFPSKLVELTELRRLELILLLLLLVMWL